MDRLGCARAPASRPLRRGVTALANVAEGGQAIASAVWRPPNWIRRCSCVRHRAVPFHIEGYRMQGRTDIYPASAQRQALLELIPALGCSDTALRRDECGDPILMGKHGPSMRSPAPPTNRTGRGS